MRREACSCKVSNENLTERTGLMIRKPLELQMRSKSEPNRASMTYAFAATGKERQRKVPDSFTGREHRCGSSVDGWKEYDIWTKCDWTLHQPNDLDYVNHISLAYT